MFKRLLNISWRDYITNDEVRRRLADLLPDDNLLTTIKKRKPRCIGMAIGHVTRSEGLHKQHSFRELFEEPGGRADL